MMLNIFPLSKAQRCLKIPKGGVSEMVCFLVLNVGINLIDQFFCSWSKQGVCKSIIRFRKFLEYFGGLVELGRGGTHKDG